MGHVGMCAGAQGREAGISAAGEGCVWEVAEEGTYTYGRLCSCNPGGLWVVYGCRDTSSLCGLSLWLRPFFFFFFNSKIQMQQCCLQHLFKP